MHIGMNIGHWSLGMGFCIVHLILNSWTTKWIVYREAKPFDYIGSVFKCFLFTSFRRNSTFFLRKTLLIARMWINLPEICSEWKIDLYDKRKLTFFTSVNFVLNDVFDWKSVKWHECSSGTILDKLNISISIAKTYRNQTNLM